MQQQEQMQKLADEFRKKLESMPVEERATFMKQMTEVITSLNQDMKGMIGILQTAKDKREVEELKSKMQGNAS